MPWNCQLANIPAEQANSKRKINEKSQQESEAKKGPEQQCKMESLTREILEIAMNPANVASWGCSFTIFLGCVVKALSGKGIRA